jgi:hypothetical protein
MGRVTLGPVCIIAVILANTRRLHRGTNVFKNPLDVSMFLQMCDPEVPGSAFVRLCEKYFFGFHLTTNDSTSVPQY